MGARGPATPRRVRRTARSAFAQCGGRMTAGRVVGLLLLLTAGLVHCEEAPAPECQVPEWPGQPPLQTPAGFRAVTDQEWTTLKPDSWDYLRRTSSKNDAICQDAANARSALEIVFTPDMAANTEPSVHWLPLPAANAVYAAWFVRLSPNWTPSPAGGGKIAFLHTPMGQVYTGFFGSHAPHHVSVNTEWAPYGQKIWDPNVTTTAIEYGKWYRIEWYMQCPTVKRSGIRRRDVRIPDLLTVGRPFRIDADGDRVRQ